MLRPIKTWAVENVLDQWVALIFQKYVSLIWAVNCNCSNYNIFTAIEWVQWCNQSFSVWWWWLSIMLFQFVHPMSNFYDDNKNNNRTPKLLLLQGERPLQVQTLLKESVQQVIGRIWWWCANPIGLNKRLNGIIMKSKY